MKLKSFQIKNFRNIHDSGICNLTEDITVLVGKNECGKTNILNALGKIRNKNFQVGDIPLYFNDKNSELIIKISFDDKELEDISNKLGLIKEELSKKNNHFFIITKEKDFIEIKSDYLELVDTKLKEIKDEIFNINASFKFPDDYHLKLNSLIVEGYDKAIETIEIEIKAITTEIKQITIRLNELPFQIADQKNNDNVINLIFESDNLKIRVNDLDKYKNELEKLKSRYMEYRNISESAKYFNAILNDKLSLLDFVYISSLENSFLSEVSIHEASKKKNKCINNFFKIFGDAIPDNILKFKDSGRDTDRIIENLKEEVRIHLEKNWVFDEKIYFDISFHNNSLIFYVSEISGKRDLDPKQRSQGLQWLLSFYFAIYANAKNNTILLIDEPGIYLHPSAQQKVLNMLEEFSKTNQIIITTHSPFLIDSDRYDRIKLVEKNNDTNEVSIIDKPNTIQDGDSKHEALTPIFNAMGLPLSKSLLFSFNKIILTEGVSDHFYFTAMKKYLQQNGRVIDECLFFLPNKSASKIPIVASLLKAWELNYLILLDNDPAGDQAEASLENDYSIDVSMKVIRIGKKGESVEDLLTKKDFDKYVLEKKREHNTKNSKIVKNEEKGKLANKFFTKIINEKIELEQETIDNFKRVFEEIEKKYAKF